jgi:hypothetical protein
MGEFYGRKVKLQIDDLIVDELRVSFRIERAHTPPPNTAVVQVYNLSPSSRKAVHKKGVRLVLEAGYADGIEQLCAGDTRTASTTQTGADAITKIECGDGEALQRTSRISESFKKGTAIASIAEKVAKATGLGLGNIKDKIQAGDVDGLLTETLNGKVVSGNAYAILVETMKSLGYKVSVQDGQLVALADGETTNETVYSLAPDSGLIGSPEAGEKGIIKARSLLLPALRPGRRVELRSRIYDGLFRIEKAVHVGDTHGTEWYSDTELRPL